MGRHLLCSPLLLVGIAVVTFLMPLIDARRMAPSPLPRLEVPQVTPGDSIIEGGWRPVIDSRISYEPSHQHVHLMTGPSGPSAPEAKRGDQTVDLVPPPYQSPKPNKKNTPTTRKPNVKGHKGAFSELSASETRVSPSGAFTIPPPEPSGPSRPMRFPDEKRRNNVRRRPAVAHHHHHHHNDHHHHDHQADRNRNNFKVRQNNYATAESTQQLRFRPSPQIAPTFENTYPSWLVQNQNEEQTQTQTQPQQQVYYNSDNSAILQQLQSQFTPEAQYQLAVSQQQQQPEVATQFQQQSNAGGFLPGTTQVFGNAGIFNLNPELQQNGNNLFLAQTATEPSVHENEVPQGPQVYVSHTTRGRPQRPIYDIATDIPKFPITEPTVPSFQHIENSDYRPRRPRPPSGIQAQLESTRVPIHPDENIRPSRPIEEAHQDENVEITKLRPRHPRPPSTEPPSWSHPVLEGEPTRQRRPRPPPQQQTEPEAPRIRRPQQQVEPEAQRVRRPRPPVQEQSVEEQQEVPRPRRPLRPSIQDNDWKPSTAIPNQPESGIREVVDVDVKSRKPRPPPPVEEQVEDDVERPVFTLRPRRPQPIREPEQTIEEEEKPVQRPRRPRPPVETESNPRPEENKQEEAASAQEDVDDSVNVRPRRPRPPENEERPRVRRPRPPVDSLKRRRPRPPSNEEEEVIEHKRRRPVLRPEEHEERKESRRPAAIKTAFEEERDDSYAVSEAEEPQEEVIASFHEEIVTEAPTVQAVPETTPLPITTTTQPPASIPNKRRRPIIKPVEQDLTDEVTENYPVNFRVSTEAIVTTQAPQTTTEPPTTTKSLINNRLRARLNTTRPRFSVSGSYKDRLNRLSALSNKNNDEPTAAPTANAEIQRTHHRNRESSRFKLGTPIPTTEESATTERTTFRPNMSRYSRPGNKFYSRYRATTEEPATTAALQDATRRTSDDIFSVKQRRPFPLKSNNAEHMTDNDMAVTSMSFSEVSTMTPTEEIGTTPMSDMASEQEEETTEIPTTFPPEPAPTPAEDFSPARRVTDLTSSATAFKPLSFFSAVPANGKHASQLSSRFTMATEDPILPIQAFFPTFSSKPNKDSYSSENM